MCVAHGVLPDMMIEEVVELEFRIGGGSRFSSLLSGFSFCYWVRVGSLAGVIVSGRRTRSCISTMDIYTFVVDAFTAGERQRRWRSVAISRECRRAWGFEREEGRRTIWTNEGDEQFDAVCYTIVCECGKHCIDLPS